MRKLTANRIAATVVGLVLAAGFGAVAGAVTEVVSIPRAAHASSTGGPITRSEVLDRARFWVNQGVTYTQTGTWAQDPEGDKTYRRDCSGLVSMAWHLTTSYVTGHFVNTGGSYPWHALGSAHDLKPGDAMVYNNGPGDGHIELFAFWKTDSDHSRGAYVYSFNSTGETVQNPYAKTNYGHLGFNTWSNINSYTPIRYNKILENAPQPGPTPPSPYQTSGQFGDFNGDGKPEIAGFDAAGSGLYIHPNTSTPGNPSLVAGGLVSSGWSTISDFVVTDYDGDGKDDIIGRQVGSGALLLWRSTSSGTSITFAPYDSLGTGWNAIGKFLPPGDFNGDGKPELGGFDLSGSGLYIHPNASTPGNPLLVAGGLVSAGWGSISDYVVTDYDGDGKDDIIGRQVGSSSLMLWRSTSSGTSITFAPFDSFGTGWNNIGKFLPMSDYNGDGKPDIAGLDLAGNGLYIHPNASTPGNPLMVAGGLVSAGWGTISDYVGGDYDGDGKDDIIGRQVGSSSLMLWRSTSSGTSFSFANYYSFGTGWNLMSKFITTAPVE